MLQIELISDFVCPWCYIGLRRLDAALALVRRQQPDFTYTCRWQPFFLNPDTPAEGEPYLPFLEQKFGSRARVEQIFAQVRAAGAEYGLDFHFERIALRANTLAAHRLVDRWQQQGRDARPLVEQLFAAQFLAGQSLSDLALLSRLAAACGDDAQEIHDFLASTVDASRVLAAGRANLARGVRSIPTFMLDPAQLVVGAEDPARLAAAMLAAARLKA